MKIIELSRGKFAIVDDADFEYLNQFNWHAKPMRNDNNFYAVRSRIVEGKWKCIHMHNEIMGLSGIDHKDRNGLNNQRGNLRKCSASQNSMNRSRRIGAISMFKGVSKDRRRIKRPWIVQFHPKNRPKIFVGGFESEYIAAKCYDFLARLYYGEFANPNMPLNYWDGGRIRTAKS